MDSSIVAEIGTSSENSRLSTLLATETVLMIFLWAIISGFVMMAVTGYRKVNRTRFWGNVESKCALAGC